ncbi:MAG: [protein-PII] uridylyltransferase [Sideroxydans sp.]
MPLARLRNSLRDSRQALQQEYVNRPHPARYLRAHARIVDEHLLQLWRAAGLPETLALVAVGGYGRAELFPKSDIDLLILLPAAADAGLEKRLQSFIGQLWDMGLEVGHSVRTVAECIEQSRDLTVQTNLLESRLLTGSTRLFEQLHQELRAHLDPCAFYTAKQAEQTQRHTRYVDIDFNLEPNLKESPGGLRDLQTVLWIARGSGFGHTWPALAQAGLLTREEARQAARDEHFLQDLRIRLHFLCGRHDDRLVFEYQQPLAEQLGIVTTPQLRASERMMRRYYRTRRAVQQLNAVLLHTMKARLFPHIPTEPINERFVARAGTLEARSEDLFEQQPVAILESFLLLQRHPELNGFSAATLRALWRARKHINKAFRNDPQVRQQFLQMFREPRGLTHALRRMNQLDILGRYLPAFGRVVGQMQHDLFHVYTVDEHILMVVRNLRRFTLDIHAHEFPLCSQLIKRFAHPEVLYLAGLFHDIAKGRGGDHSVLGSVDAARFCRRHHLPREDRELIVWLVEHHLRMSSTAQKQDITDQDVVARFAAHIPNLRHLTALYLLTVADMCGTSPKVWNAWKGKLLEDLFHATHRFMTRGKLTDQVGETQRLAAQMLNLAAISPESYRLFWKQLGNEYFIRHEAHEIAWHTRQLAPHVHSTSPIVRTRLAPADEGIQVLVYAPDQPYLFAQICHFFARLNYSIVEAKVHTTQHGYALDSLLIMNANADQSAYRDVMNYIEFELAGALSSSALTAMPRSSRVSRQLKNFPIETRISIGSDEKGRYPLSIVTGDRPGLLARIALILARHGIELHGARINTLGARAEDVFWISGKSLRDENFITALRTELQQQLS